MVEHSQALMRSRAKEDAMPLYVIFNMEKFEATEESELCMYLNCQNM